jgi:hypothetical protein
MSQPTAPSSLDANFSQLRPIAAALGSRLVPGAAPLEDLIGRVRTALQRPTEGASIVRPRQA